MRGSAIDAKIRVRIKVNIIGHRIQAKKKSGSWGYEPLHGERH
jgi:hypothetical protein